MRPALVTAIVLAGIGCDSGQTVFLQSDNGAESVSYDCAAWDTQVASSSTIVADYSLRLARVAAAERDTARLLELMGPYEAKDWATLERFAVEHACANAVLAAAQPAFPEPGTTAPDFTLPSLTGGELVRLAESRGRITVVDFWATWCVPCLDQLPDLAELAAKYPDRIAVIAVLHKDSPALAAEWVAENLPSPLTLVTDPGGDVGRAYGVRGIPATFVIDVDGTLMPAADNHRVRMWYRDLDAYLTGR